MINLNLKSVTINSIMRQLSYCCWFRSTFSLKLANLHPLFAKSNSSCKNYSKTYKLAVALFIGLTAMLQAMDDARLLRFPDINQNLIAFVYAGDIWTVNASGGEARRLTSHEGLELFPKISPDGKWIAFSAEYSGSRQIWVMPSEGGPAKQLPIITQLALCPRAEASTMWCWTGCPTANKL
jgi:tricorn protease-like protein